MTDKLKKAAELLASGGHTLVLFDGEQCLTSDLPGVSSLLRFAESGDTYSSFCAADKVIGKGAAFLYVLMNVKGVYGGVVSKRAKAVFDEYGIPCCFGTLVPHIINRSGDGICPVESAAEKINSPEQAVGIIKDTLNKLSNERKKEV